MIGSDKEVVAGHGKVYSEEKLVCETPYQVHIEERVAQEPVIGATQPVIEARRIKGTISPSPEDLSACLHIPTPLTLRLADGRRLDFFLADSSGRIAPTARGLYEVSG